jgi:hypothetical protein
MSAHYISIDALNKMHLLGRILGEWMASRSSGWAGP